VHQRAERLFTILNTPGSSVPLHLLAGKKGGKNSSSSLESLRPVAEREFVIHGLCVEIRDVVGNTESYNEKKVVQSYQERQKDEKDMEESEPEEEEKEEKEDEEKPIYNPLNLPLGWDGKPIPYWLYKVCSLVCVVMIVVWIR
jgi:hypothetical protein